MTKGEEFRAIYEKVRDTELKMVASEYFNIIIKELEECARAGKESMHITSEDFPSLYTTGSPVVEKELEALLKVESIRLIHTRQEGYYVQF